MRRYNRYRNKRSNNIGIWVVLILILIFLLIKVWKILLILSLVVGIFAIIATIVNWYFKNKQAKSYALYDDESYKILEREIKDNKSNTPKQDSPKEIRHVYTAKDSFMTECEKEFFNIFNEIVGDKFIVQPQINLASIVSKDNHDKYRNELFRNIDFGIFDKNYKLKLLIEINDRTHEQAERIERDKKVKAICEEAGVELIIFWTKYGINKEYIYNRLNKYLDVEDITIKESTEL